MFFKTKINALTAALAAMTLDRDAAQAQLTALGADPAAALSALTLERDEARIEAAGHAGTIAGLRIQLAALEAAQTTVREEGARLAVDIAANVSVAPVGADPGPGAPQGNSDKDIFARYQAIEDSTERFKFYKANSAAICRATAG